DRRTVVVNRIQMMQDLLGAIVLFPAASARLQAGLLWHSILGAVEALAILVALIAAVRELMQKDHEAQPAVDLTNLFIGTVLLIENGFRVAAGHKIFSPMLLMGLSAIVIAFARPYGMARRRRYLRMDDTGFLFRSSPFRKLRIDWATVAGLEEDESQLRFKLDNGKTHTVNLKRYSNRDELRTAFMERARLANLNIHQLKGQ
ncbi:MAG TPA: hypothetical protein VM100_01100, partial [Longimicrobiales bacterium]|nr:hypothetical protein [Longimicrobiales bacterium]